MEVCIIRAHVSFRVQCDIVIMLYFSGVLLLRCYCSAALLLW